eukprot:6207961-Pleurochrysis_carterae.AAC.2
MVCLRGWCTAELYVHSIALKGNSGRHSVRHGIVLPVEEHLIAQKSNPRTADESIACGDLSPCMAASWTSIAETRVLTKFN